jgi:abortive infection bacteriophage resistance protein
MRTLAGFFFGRLGHFRGKEERMLFNKPPLAVPDQIRLLKERDMVFADEARATRVLQHINYYRLRAYWLPFEAQLSARPAHAQHAFKPGTEFDNVVALYIFDRKLRLLLLEAIERVEIAMRTHWAQVLAERYGSHAYLRGDLFQKPAIFDACLKSMDEELSRSKETFVQHYLDKYTDPSRPPIWAICELLTLGQLSKWLGNVKLRNDRQAMAHRLGLDEVVVCAFAHHLTHVRNLCAHHSRVWNRKLTFTMTLPRRPSELAVQFNAPEDRRIYNTLVMLVWCIKTISPDTTWPNRMHALLSTRTTADLKSMGAPGDWASRSTWR